MPEPKVLQELIDGRAKIKDSRNWAGSVLTLGSGRECAVTAVGSESDAYQILRKLCGKDSLGAWNDEHRHADVLALYDRAIKEVS